MLQLHPWNHVTYSNHITKMSGSSCKIMGGSNIANNWNEIKCFLQWFTIMCSNIISLWWLFQESVYQLTSMTPTLTRQWWPWTSLVQPHKDVLHVLPWEVRHNPVIKWISRWSTTMFWRSSSQSRTMSRIWGSHWISPLMELFLQLCMVAKFSNR